MTSSRVGTVIRANMAKEAIEDMSLVFPPKEAASFYCSPELFTCLWFSFRHTYCAISNLLKALRTRTQGEPGMSKQEKLIIMDNLTKYKDLYEQMPKTPHLRHFHIDEMREFLSWAQTIVFSELGPILPIRVEFTSSSVN